MMGVVKKVLVVDDEQPILELFTALLERRGHKVDVAENGRIGFRKATTTSYDLVIFDLHMPEWNGIDAIKGILLVKPKSKFLVVSGYAENAIADELRAIKAVKGILEKPANLEEIISYVEDS
jgi:YesN/AraC family two-component response regulator